MNTFELSRRLDRNRRDILAALCDTGSAAFEIQSLCNDATGNHVGYRVVTFLGTASTITYYDTDWAILASQPANSVVCEDDVPPGIVDTDGSHVIGTIQDSGTATLSSGAISVSDGIRIASVAVESSTLVEISVTLDDGSTFTHRLFGGTYHLELEDNQSPITLITATEIDDVSTRVIINWLSKE